MPICGIEKLYVAKQLTDASGGMTFDTPIYYPNVKALDIKPKVNVEAGYAENRLVDQATLFDSADIALDRYSMTSAERAYLLNQTIAAAGGVVASLGDAPPYVAILYKAPIRTNDDENAFRYGVIYKTLFNPPDDTMKGLEGKPDLKQTPKITGKAQSTNWSFTDGNSVEKHPWEYHVDTTDPNCPVDIDSTWFAAVAVPGADVTPPTVTPTPADDASNVAISANMVWTFNEAIDTSKVTSANFFLMKATDGSLVAGALNIDGTGKIVTLDPTSNLSAGTEYIAICTKNVTDIAGNALAATSVTNFTTAS